MSQKWSFKCANVASLENLTGMFFKNVKETIAAAQFHTVIFYVNGSRIAKI